MAVGLSGVLLGWLTEAYWRNGIGWIVIGTGIMALVAGIRSLTMHAPRTTRYRRQTWSARDTLLVAFSLAPLVAIVALAVFDPQALAFYPYPRVMLPPFDARLGLCLALLGVPAFMRPDSHRQAIQSMAAVGK